MYEDSADDVLESSNMITENMILSDSSSMHLIESRGLPRVTSSPGPLRFESSAEASSFLTQNNNMVVSRRPSAETCAVVSAANADD